MALTEIALTAENKQVPSVDLATIIGKGLAKILFNGSSEQIIDNLVTSPLTLISPAKYDVGFELHSGKTSLGDVYFSSDGDTRKVWVDFLPNTSEGTRLALEQYLSK